MQSNSQPKETPATMSLGDAYITMMEPCSECPFIYHRWTLVSVVGALLGRQCSLDFGMETLYPNMYICLIGNAGSRKSSAIKSGRIFADAAGYTNFGRERTSKEKFLKDLSIGFDTVNADSDDEVDLADIQILGSDIKREGPSEVYISAGELEDFLGQGDAPFISLLTNLWDNLPKYGHGKMTSKDILIDQPTINMLGGCTPTTFMSVFPPEVIGQGMLSRMLLVYGGGARTKITLPPAPDPALKQEIIEQLVAIKENIHGKFTLTPEAYKVWDAIYQSDYNIPDSRFENYINRRHVHYMKLCMIMAAMELSMTITEEIAIQANSILHYAETLMPKALGEFGRARDSEGVNSIYEAVKRHYDSTGYGLKAHAIFKMVSTNFDSFAKDFQTALMKLVTAGKLSSYQGVLVPTTINSASSLPFVDLESVLEYQDDRRQRKCLKTKTNHK